MQYPSTAVIVLNPAKWKGILNASDDILRNVSLLPFKGGFGGEIFSNLPKRLLAYIAKRGTAKEFRTLMVN